MAVQFDPSQPFEVVEEETLDSLTAPRVRRPAIAAPVIAGPAFDPSKPFTAVPEVAAPSGPVFNPNAPAQKIFSIEDFANKSVDELVADKDYQPVNFGVQNKEALLADPALQSKQEQVYRARETAGTTAMDKIRAAKEGAIPGLQAIRSGIGTFFKQGVKMNAGTVAKGLYNLAAGNPEGETFAKDFIKSQAEVAASVELASLGTVDLARRAVRELGESKLPLVPALSAVNKPKAQQTEGDWRNRYFNDVELAQKVEEAGRGSAEVMKLVGIDADTLQAEHGITLDPQVISELSVVTNPVNFIPIGSVVGAVTNIGGKLVIRGMAAAKTAAQASEFAGILNKAAEAAAVTKSVTSGVVGGTLKAVGGAVEATGNTAQAAVRSTLGRGVGYGVGLGSLLGGNVYKVLSGLAIAKGIPKALQVGGSALKRAGAVVAGEAELPAALSLAGQTAKQATLGGLQAGVEGAIISLPFEIGARPEEEEQILGMVALGAAAGAGIRGARPGVKATGRAAQNKLAETIFQHVEQADAPETPRYEGAPDALNNAHDANYAKLSPADKKLVNWGRRLAPAEDLQIFALDSAGMKAETGSATAKGYAVKISERADGKPVVHIYLNTDAQALPHEFFHALEILDPKPAKSLIDSVKKTLTPAEFKSFEQQYNSALNNGHPEKFWKTRLTKDEVYREIAAEGFSRTFLAQDLSGVAPAVRQKAALFVSSLLEKLGAPLAGVGKPKGTPGATALGVRPGTAQVKLGQQWLGDILARVNDDGTLATAPAKVEKAPITVAESAILSAEDLEVATALRRTQVSDKAIAKHFGITGADVVKVLGAGPTKAPVPVLPRPRPTPTTPDAPVPAPAAPPSVPPPNVPIAPPTPAAPKAVVPADITPLPTAPQSYGTRYVTEQGVAGSIERINHLRKRMEEVGPRQAENLASESDNIGRALQANPDYDWVSNSIKPRNIRTARTAPKDTAGERSQVTGIEEAKASAAATGNANTVARVNELSELLNQPVEIVHSGAKAAGTVESPSGRTARRAEVALGNKGSRSTLFGRGGVREKYSKVTIPDRWVVVAGKPQLLALLAFSLDKIFTNMDTLAARAAEKGVSEKIPYPTEAGKFSEATSELILDGISAYAENQRNGRKGDGTPLTRPAEEIGVSIPPENPDYVPRKLADDAALAEQRMNFINALMGTDPFVPRTARETKGQVPGNVKGQIIAEVNARKPQKPSVMRPEDITKQEFKSYPGRSIAEMNPLRDELAAAGVPMRELLDANERIFAKDISQVVPRPDLEIQLPVTDTIRGGFLPGEKLHDFQASQEYSVARLHPEVRRALETVRREVLSEISNNPVFRDFSIANVKPGSLGDSVAKYVDGTSSEPVIVIDGKAHLEAAGGSTVDLINMLKESVLHELEHANQDAAGQPMSERLAERTARRNRSFMPGVGKGWIKPDGTFELVGQNHSEAGSNLYAKGWIRYVASRDGNDILHVTLNSERGRVKPNPKQESAIEAWKGSGASVKDDFGSFLPAETAEAIRDVQAMTPDEFMAAAKSWDGGLTTQAWKVGLDAVTPEDVAALKAAHADASTTARERMKIGSWDAAASWGARSQFFREAFEAATDTGSAAGEIGWRTAFPDRQAPFPEAKSVGAFQPGEIPKELASEKGYVYHATNLERLREIADSGKLKTFKPDDFTDQQVWPDGAIEKRAYFSRNANVIQSFAPEEGQSVAIRAKETPQFNRESTGDIFTRREVSAEQLEYLDESGVWKPVSELSAAANR